MSFKRYGFNRHMLGKRSRLLEQGVNPYPYEFNTPQPIDSVMPVSEQAGDDPITLVGRLWARRKMGKAVFMDLRDHSGKIQLHISRDTVSAQLWEMLPLLDLGDIVGVEGTTFTTKTGQLTVSVETLTVLAKSVVPLPLGKGKDDEAFSRVSDPEAKYRQRHLHWMLNEADRELIVRRSAIVSAVRRRVESIIRSAKIANCPGGKGVFEKSGHPNPQ